MGKPARAGAGCRRERGVRSISRSVQLAVRFPLSRDRPRYRPRWRFQARRRIRMSSVAAGGPGRLAGPDRTRINRAPMSGRSTGRER